MFVLAVQGTYEPYHPRFDRHATAVEEGRRGERSARAGREESPPVVDPVRLAAQNAYARTQAGPQPRKPALLARDLMRTPVTVLRPTDLLADAWAQMKAKGFRHIPIVSEGGSLAGIVSDRDLLRFANVLDRREDGSLPAAVQEIMTSRVLTATSTTEIRDIARVMVDETISAIPIIDEANRPIGMLTVTDILRAVVNRAPLELWS